MIINVANHKSEIAFILYINKYPFYHIPKKNWFSLYLVNLLHVSKICPFFQISNEFSKELAHLAEKHAEEMAELKVFNT
jgi:hypothetical protein